MDALLDGRIRTSLGRVRAINTLNCRGRAVKGAATAFLRVLGDRSVRVVDCALHGLVFLQDKANLPALKAEAPRRGQGGKGYAEIMKAIEALEREDPFLYSPSFEDSRGIWELDPARFPGGRRRSEHNTSTSWSDLRPGGRST